MVSLGYLKNSKQGKIENSNQFSDKPNPRSLVLANQSFLDLNTVPTKINQVIILIRSLYPNPSSQISFTSKDIYDLFHQEIRSEISQSTVSTYLSRLLRENVIIRSGNKKDYIYRLKKEFMNKIPYYSRLEKKFIQNKR